MTPRDLSLTATVPGDTLGTSDLDCIPASTSTDAAVQQEVLQWLWDSSLRNLDGVPYRYTSNNQASDGYFGAAMWQFRALAAYRTATAAGWYPATARAQLNSWFIACARYHATHLDDIYYGLSSVFPKRAQGDYTARAKEASTGKSTGVLAHRDGKPIPVLATYWNNRRSQLALFVGTAGVYFGDVALTECAKRYVKEWIAYSVFDDGSQGEWLRNGNYDPVIVNGTPMPYVTAGVTYGAYNEACAVLLADALHSAGDDELLRYRTRAGLWGTESKGPKSIWTALDAHVSVLDGSRDWYDARGRLFDQNSTPYGRANHASWCLPVIRNEKRYASLVAWSRTTAAKYDDPYGLWRGIGGAWMDVRL